jgi:hypothetical protein
MSNSFYTKEGLDYLYFARPGTAYGAQAFQNTKIGTETKQGFYDSKT